MFLCLGASKVIKQDLKNVQCGDRFEKTIDHKLTSDLLLTS